MNTKFVVSTQGLELYGDDEHSYHKYKLGNEYLVGARTVASAIAAVMLYLVGSNNDYWVEYPLDAVTKEEWESELPDDDHQAEIARVQLIALDYYWGTKQGEGMSCKNCGGTMHGDGYTSPVVCEYAEVDTLEPDAGPVYCTFEEQ